MVDFSVTLVVSVLLSHSLTVQLVRARTHVRGDSCHCPGPSVVFVVGIEEVVQLYWSSD